MYCLDTNIIIDLFKKDKIVTAKMEKIKDLGFFISPVTLYELYKGAYLSSRVSDNLNDIRSFLSSVLLLDFDNLICESVGTEFSRLQNLGKIPQEFDLIIGVMAKINNLTLITRNKKDFENIDVKIEAW